MISAWLLTAVNHKLFKQWVSSWRMGIQGYQAKELPFVLDTKCWLDKLILSWESESDLYSCCGKPQIAGFQDMMIYLNVATTIFDT